MVFLSAMSSRALDDARGLLACKLLMHATAIQTTNLALHASQESQLYSQVVLFVYAGFERAASQCMGLLAGY